ncbi:MAG TPA: ATP-binding protein [Terriglobia bacterium]|nr:ATP-binding protein [Terriglobia bacterium]
MAASRASKWSLQTRTLVTVVFLSLSVLTITDWLATLSTIHAIEKSMGEQTAKSAERLAFDLKARSVQQVPDYYQNQVRDILELEPDVIHVDIYAEKEGQLKLVQSSSTRKDRAVLNQERKAFFSGLPQTFTVESAAGSKIFSTQPLQFKDGRRGFVTVASSLRIVNDILAVHFRIRLYAILGTTVLLVGTIVLVFRATVYRSVQHLVKIMHRYKSGELSARADESLAGEFGELARNFNRMLEEIQGFSENLRHQVEEATGELTRRNRDLQQLNLQIYEAKKRLTQAERLALVGQVTATFAHEIGSPLSAVATHLQILLEDPQLDLRIRERLQLACDQIDRVCNIVETLLNTTRHKARRLPIELEEIICKVTRLLGPTLESRRIDFRLRTYGGPFLTEGDPDQLEQLFLNLFNNALDAITGEGKLWVEVHREPLSEDSNQYCFRIEVRDSGVGIPADKLDHIFEPFFTTKDFGRGSGLGLAIGKEIVKQHGGQIRVVSSPAKGTCFTILLPEVESVAAERSAAIRASNRA